MKIHKHYVIQGDNGEDWEDNHQWYASLNEEVLYFHKKEAAEEYCNKLNQQCRYVSALWEDTGYAYVNDDELPINLDYTMIDNHFGLFTYEVKEIRFTYVDGEK